MPTLLMLNLCSDGSYHSANCHGRFNDYVNTGPGTGPLQLSKAGWTPQAKRH